MGEVLLLTQYAMWKRRRLDMDQIQKQKILKYQLDNLFLYDTPGLGDDPLKNSLYKENLVCMLNKTNDRKDRFS